MAYYTVLVTFAIFALYVECKMFNYGDRTVFYPSERIAPIEYHRERRQVSGPLDISNSPSEHQIGLRLTPGWLKLMQEFNRRGVPAPTIVQGGVYWTPQTAKIAMEFNAQHQFHRGSEIGVKGTKTVFQSGDHAVNAFASHQKNLNGRPETNSGGLTYSHANGASLTVSGNKTPGSPSSGSISATVPVASTRDGSVQVSVSGTTNLMAGNKPNHHVGLDVAVSPH